jgi:hypothetical protein
LRGKEKKQGRNKEKRLEGEGKWRKKEIEMMCRIYSWHISLVSFLSTAFT